LIERLISVRRACYTVDTGRRKRLRMKKHIRKEYFVLKGLGDLGKMGGMLKQAMEMKGRIEEIKESLAEEQIEASAGGGMVSVLINGKLEVLSVKIDPEVVNADDVEMLETLVQAAFNEASGKMREVVKEKMQEVAGGLDIPGLT
jgi:nucleoid-associated protein EbfC